MKEVEENNWLVSLAGTSKNGRLVFVLVLVMVGICVTVRLHPHIPFRSTFGRAAEGCGGARTVLLHIIGCAAGHRP